MAYELRRDKTDDAVATLATIDECYSKVIEYMRVFGFDRIELRFGTDCVFEAFKTGNKVPTFRVVKVDLRSRPQGAEQGAALRGRPPKDQTNLRLSAMPAGANTWLFLKGKDQKLLQLDDYKSVSDDRPVSLAVYCTEKGGIFKPHDFRTMGKPGASPPEQLKMRKVINDVEDVKKLVDSPKYPWPEGSTHVLVGKVSRGQFVAYWLFRKS